MSSEKPFPLAIDTHLHLHFKEFDSEREKVIQNCAERGIILINSSIGPEEVEVASRLARDHKNVYWTLGLRASSTNLTVAEETITLLKKYRKEIVGVGEVGLDYYWVKDKEERKLEEKIFQNFIEVSVKLNLPLVVHSRDAEGRTLSILEEMDKPALLHCFSGSLEQAERAISFGCLISIPTSILYSKRKQEIARVLPLNSIVLESDSPYLSPIPKTKNTPLNILKSAEFIAKLREISTSEVLEKTTLNAQKFFNL